MLSDEENILSENSQGTLPMIHFLDFSCETQNQLRCSISPLHMEFLTAFAKAPENTAPMESMNASPFGCGLAYLACSITSSSSAFITKPQNILFSSVSLQKHTGMAGLLLPEVANCLETSKVKKCCHKILKSTGLHTAPATRPTLLIQIFTFCYFCSRVVVEKKCNN